jgi:uncharacterized RmlC-like cupin family protein
MKATKTIDRTLTPKSGTAQPGIITEFMVSNDTCATEHLLGTYCTILPGGKSQLRRHNRVECAWYLVKGRIKEIIVDENNQITETICEAGDAGYINPGDAHQEINLSITETAELIVCYAHPENERCNCFEDTDTEVVSI